MNAENTPTNNPNGKKYVSLKGFERTSNFLLFDSNNMLNRTTKRTEAKIISRVLDSTLTTKKGAIDAVTKAPIEINMDGLFK